MPAQTTTLTNLLACDRFYRVMQGGMSSGKTFAALCAIIGFAEENPHTLSTIVTDTVPNLRNGAERDFRHILHDTGRVDYYSYSATRNIWTVKGNGSQIEFLALDDPMKARGARRDALYVNEANRIGYETFDQMASRTRRFVILDYNPSSRFWVHDELLTKYRSETDFRISTYVDNEALSESEIRNIERHDRHSNWWRVYGLGQLGELENNIYTGWQRLDGIPQSGELLGYGLDYGNSPDPTAMVALWRSEGMIIFEQVFEHANLLNSQLTELIHMAVSQRGDRPIICDYGGGGAALIEELQRAGLQAVNADKRAGSVLAGIDMVRQIPHVGYVGADLEREYLAYQHRVKRGSGEILPTPQDGNDHLLDALRYGWYVLHADEVEREASLLRASMYGEDDDGVGEAWG